MVQRPAHLTDENAARFGAAGVAAAYACRLPYPAELFDILESLAAGGPRAVVDLGTGTGDLARPLASRFERVDAVDVSHAMIDRGKSLPGGDAANLRWILSRAEDAPLTPTYALATAGESLHWMDWEVVLPRLADAMAPGGMLAVAYRNELPPSWQDELMTLIREVTPMRNYQDYDLIQLLESRGLLEHQGSRTVRSSTMLQPVEDYVRSFHSRASLTAEALGPDGVRTFDTRLRALVAPWTDDGRVRLEWAPVVTWGRPLNPEAWSGVEPPD